MLIWKLGNLFGMLLEPCPSICWCGNHFICLYTKWKPRNHKQVTAYRKHLYFKRKILVGETL